MELELIDIGVKVFVNLRSCRIGVYPSGEGEVCKARAFSGYINHSRRKSSDLMIGRIVPEPSNVFVTLKACHIEALFQEILDRDQTLGSKTDHCDGELGGGHIWLWVGYLHTLSNTNSSSRTQERLTHNACIYIGNSGIGVLPGTFRGSEMALPRSLQRAEGG